MLSGGYMVWQGCAILTNKILPAVRELYDSQVHVLDDGCAG
jgi:hypothetical protein